MSEEVKDLRAELGEAFDAAEKVEAPIETPAPVEEAAPVEAKDDRPRDEHGRFLPKSEAKEEQKSEVKDETPKAEVEVTEKPAEEPKPVVEGVDLPPSTWTPAAKAAYRELPEVVRKEIRKRESDFTRGINQYKQAADEGGKLAEAVKPFQHILQAENATPESAVRNALGMIANLRSGTPQERANYVLWLGQQYGADFSSLGATQQEGQDVQRMIQQAVAQAVQPYTQQFQQLTQERERQQQEAQQQIRSQIEAFRTATDEKGSPKHIYFDNVWGLMVPLLQTRQAQNLEQAYEMACHAHPEVRTALSAERQRQDEAKRLEEARRKAADAARATAVNVTGQGGVGIADTSKLSLRDELARHMEGARF